MTTIDQIDHVQTVYEKAQLGRLNEFVDFLLTATNMDVPDFQAAAQEIADHEPKADQSPKSDQASTHDQDAKSGRRTTSDRGPNSGHSGSKGHSRTDDSARATSAASVSGSAFVPDDVDLSAIPGVTAFVLADPVAAARVKFVKDLYSAVPTLAWNELAGRLDKTLGQVQAFARKLLKARFLLPRLFAKVTATGHGFDRLDCATSRAIEMEAGLWDFYDRCLETVDSRAGMRYFRATVNTAVDLLKTPSRDAEQAHEKRCVQIMDLHDGRSMLQMIGPTLEVQALMKRLEAFARAIRQALSGVLEDATTEGGQPLTEAGIDADSIELTDERTMAQLIFDMLAAYAPSLGIEISRTGKTTEEETDDREPRSSHSVRTQHDTGLDTGFDTVPGGESAAEPALRPGTSSEDGTDAPSGTQADGCADADADAESIIVRMPTRTSWLQAQAQISVLVPVTTLLGISKLPATLAGFEPVPADAALALAAGDQSLARLLCDPATGEILDEPAKSYRINPAMRRTLEAKYSCCTMPGCTRPAARCETEHIVPFNHANPAAGGLSTFMNTHLMCRHHHGLKTARQMQVRRTTDRGVEYSWTSPTAPSGFTTEVTGQNHLLGAIAARELRDRVADLCRQAQEAGLAGRNTPEPQDDNDDGVPHDSVPNGDAPDDSAPDGGIPESPALDGSASDGSTADDTASDKSGPEDSASDDTATDGSTLFALEHSWDRLDSRDRLLPTIKALRAMLAAEGLLPPIPVRKLDEDQELEVLYRIARAAHLQAYPHREIPADECPTETPVWYSAKIRKGPRYTCLAQDHLADEQLAAACPVHAASTDAEDRAACLGVTSHVPDSASSVADAPARATAAAEAAAEADSSSAAGRPAVPLCGCPFDSEWRPSDWKPAGWIEFARHRTVEEILADPWRHDEPLIVRDAREADEQVQAEWEADQPPF